MRDNRVFREIKTCMVPDCDRAVFVRGQCKRCYSIATQAVRRGLTTWENLIKNKKILPAGIKGKKRSVYLNWMLEDNV